MRVFILGLALTLGALWPQCTMAFLKVPRPPLPAPPAIKWTGPIAAINWNRSKPDSSETDQFLVFVRITDTGRGLTNYRVRFSAGALAKAEAETQDRQALFVLTQGRPSLDRFSITVTSSNVVEDEPTHHGFRGFEDWDGSISAQPSQEHLAVPIAVEVVLVPLNTIHWQQMDAPRGEHFHCTMPSPICRRFVLDLAPVGKNFDARFLNLTGRLDYCTGPFSMTRLKSEPTAFAAEHFSWTVTRPRSELPSQLQPLNGLLCADQCAGIGTMDIQSVEWRKGTAGETFYPNASNEWAFFVAFDEQKPEMIVMRLVPETPLSEIQSGSRSGHEIFGLESVFYWWRANHGAAS